MNQSESHSSGRTLSTVLVVDGEVLVRTAIAEYLRHCGYKVIEAATGDEALIVLNEASLDIDVILCDAGIGGSINGFMLAQHIRERHSDLKLVLAGSVSSAADAAAELCDDGPRLKRPYDPQQVVEHIKRLMGKRGQGKPRTNNLADETSIRKPVEAPDRINP